MRRILLALLVAAASARAETLEERFEKKLKSPFVKNAAWVLDYDEARRKAKADGKVIFAYFTRSFAP